MSSRKTETKWERRRLAYSERAARAQVCAEAMMHATAPTTRENGEPMSESFAAGFKEPNSGRQLYIRKHAGGRIGIFDGQSNFVLDVDAESLRTMKRQLGGLHESIARSNDELQIQSQGYPALGHPPRDAVLDLFPGMILTEEDVRALSGGKLSIACGIEGVAVHAKDTAITKARLSSHFESKRACAGIDVRNSLNSLRDVNLAQGNCLVKVRDELKNTLAALKVSDQDREVHLARVTGISTVNQGLLAQVRKLGEDLACLRTEREQMEKRIAADETVKLGLRHDVRSALDQLEDANRACVALQSREAEREEKMGNNYQSPGQYEGTVTDGADPEGLATPPPSGALVATPTVAEVFASAGKLATVQGATKLAVKRASPLLIKAGIPESFVMDARVQGALALALPWLISTYGHKVPGLNKVNEIQSISQQQLIIGLAEIIGVSFVDLLAIGLDLVKSLNGGDDASVEQIQGE